MPYVLLLCTKIVVDNTCYLSANSWRDSTAKVADDEDLIMCKIPLQVYNNSLKWLYDFITLI